LSAEALACLQRYDFPGNIRELRNILERASLLADGEVIGCEHLPGGAEALGRTPGLTLEDAERRALDAALKAHAGSRRSLAATLGISERTLYRKLRRLDVGPMR
jgi:transcriptional regulator of acetoin/glycerol metabolism